MAHDNSSAGQSLTKDSKTGFLVAPPPDVNSRIKGNPTHDIVGVGRVQSFSPTAKVKFISAMRLRFPNVNLACGDAGVNRRTYEYHYEIDVAFRECVQQIVKEKMDELKGRIWEMGMENPKNFLDRVCIGRMYDPEAFNRGRETIEVKHTGKVFLSTEEAKRRIAAVNEYVDADVVAQQFDEQHAIETEGQTEEEIK